MGRKTGDGKKVLEAGGSLLSKFTKRMGCPSSPAPKGTTSCFAELKRRKHRKTCGGDQKDSSSNPHFDYFKQKSS